VRSRFTTLPQKVVGRTVVWDDRSAESLGGAWATSLEEGQLAAATWAQLAAAIGGAAGAAGMSAAWLLRGSRRRAGEPLEADVADETAQGRAPTVPSAVEPPFAWPAIDLVEDTSMWAPGPGDSHSA
jgi:hypothetical protein